VKRKHPQLIDHEATALAGFRDPRSYVKRSKAGNLLTFLFGLDMAALRQKVFERSRGCCEMRLRGVLGGRCQRNIAWETMELHHEPSLGQGGCDTEEGTLASCRRCHHARHLMIRSDRAERRAHATE
jgi:hypothetical protein